MFHPHILKKRKDILIGLLIEIALLFEEDDIDHIYIPMVENIIENNVNLFTKPTSNLYGNTLILSIL